MIDALHAATAIRMYAGSLYTATSAPSAKRGRLGSVVIEAATATVIEIETAAKKAKSSNPPAQGHARGVGLANHSTEQEDEQITTPARHLRDVERGVVHEARHLEVDTEIAKDRLRQGESGVWVEGREAGVRRVLIGTFLVVLAAAAGQGQRGRVEGTMRMRSRFVNEIESALSLILGIGVGSAMLGIGTAPSARLGRGIRGIEIPEIKTPEIETPEIEIPETVRPEIGIVTATATATATLTDEEAAAMTTVRSPQKSIATSQALALGRLMMRVYRHRVEGERGLVALTATAIGAGGNEVLFGRGSEEVAVKSSRKVQRSVTVTRKMAKRKVGRVLGAVA